MQVQTFFPLIGVLRTQQNILNAECFLILSCISLIQVLMCYFLFQSWDGILAEVALAWSKKCIFDHNSDLKTKGKLHPVFNTLGENIYVTAGSKVNVPAAIQLWYDEVKHYNYDSRRCTKVCGHYTQVIYFAQII